MAASEATQSETNEARVKESVQRSIWSALWWRRRLLLSELGVVATTCARHALWGPPFETWTLQLHLLTEIVRESAKPIYNHHASLRGLREAVSLDKRMPPPKHLRKYRFPIPIKSRGLAAPLDQLDKQDSHDFQVEGEWIVHDSVQNPRSRVIFFTHGGAYCSMSISSHRPLILAMSKALSCRVFAVEYGLAPEYPYPQPIFHAISAYLYLLDLGIPSENIVCAGDSAGGGLAAAMLMYLADNNMAVPGGGILISPWIDLTGALESHLINSKFDYITRPFDATHVNPVKYYLGDLRPEDTPYGSPVYASDEQMARLPPLLIQSGGVESLRDEAILFAGRAPKGSRYEIFDHGVHVFQFFVGTPAAQAAFNSMAHFDATLTPPKPFDFTDIDAKLLANKPKADEPSKPAKAEPPAFTFIEAPLSGEGARELPHPAVQSKASERLKQLVADWKPSSDYAIYAPKWEVKKSLLSSWAHL